MRNSIEFYESLRDDMVRHELSGLIRMGGLYDPFSVDHISEALSELTKNGFETLQWYCDKARFTNATVSTEEIMSMIGRLVYTEIYSYWENMALEKAEIDVPSAFELREDAIAESADAKRDAAMDRMAGL